MTSKRTYFLGLLGAVLALSLFLVGCEPAPQAPEELAPELAAGSTTPESESTAAGPLAGSHWQLVEFQSMDDAIGSIRPDDPSLYTLAFGDDGNLSMQLNCNRATGSWSAVPAEGGESGSLELGPLAMTRALCPPPSMDEKIAADMDYVRSYLLRDGQLALSLMADGGIYLWEPVVSSESVDNGGSSSGIVEIPELGENEWVWQPEHSGAGPVVVLVSLPDQLTHVYRNGIRIGIARVSTGKPGWETPTGVFTILEKHEKHVSSIFNASMPFTQRLTWGGISLHAGGLPGYPSSHGCVHLPLEFAKMVFGVTGGSTTVIIADEHSGPREVLHPGSILSPGIDEPLTEGPAAEVARFQWAPEKAVEGPITLLLSRADRTLFVYRNGVEIGQSALDLRDPDAPFGEHVYTVLDGFADQPSLFLPDHPAHRFMAVSLDADDSTESGSHLAGLIRMPPVFIRYLYDLMVPGTTIYVTDAPVEPHHKTDEEFVLGTVVGTEAG